MLKVSDWLSAVQVLEVDLDLALSAHANARALFEAKKKAADKVVRTVEGGRLCRHRPHLRLKDDVIITTRSITHAY
jgi:hypothetical protein